MSRIDRLFGLSHGSTADVILESLPRKKLTKPELELTFNNGRTVADLVELLNEFGYYIVDVNIQKKSVRFSFESDTLNPVFIAGINENGRMIIDTQYEKETPIDFVQLEYMRQCLQRLTELGKKLYDAEFIS